MLLSPCIFIDIEDQNDGSAKKPASFKLLARTATKKKIAVVDGIEAVLRGHKKSAIKNYVVYGFGLGQSIQHMVSDLIKKGLQVWIPVDAVYFRNEKNREKELIELRKLGAQMWNTAFIIKNL
jgi:hypothetical protein